jgi:hypothetical protein
MLLWEGRQSIIGYCEGSEVRRLLLVGTACTRRYKLYEAKVVSPFLHQWNTQPSKRFGKRNLMTFILLCLSLLGLFYCIYRIRNLRSDVAIAVGTGKIFLDYITQQRGALLYLVVDSLKNGANPPSQASDLEIKVARIIMRFPKSRQELEMIWNGQSSRTG